MRKCRLKKNLRRLIITMLFSVFVLLTATSCVYMKMNPPADVDKTFLPATTPAISQPGEYARRGRLWKRYHASGPGRWYLQPVNSQLRNSKRGWQTLRLVGGWALAIMCGLQTIHVVTVYGWKNPKIPGRMPTAPSLSGTNSGTVILWTQYKLATDAAVSSEAAAMRSLVGATVVETVLWQ